MRVLQVVPAYYPTCGGIEILVRQLTSTLNEHHGIDNVVLTPRKDESSLAPFVLDGTAVHPYYVPPLLAIEDRFSFLAATFAGVRRVMAQARPDVVHVHGYSELSLPAHIVARSRGLAPIMHVHGDVDPELPPGYRRHLATTDHVVAVSESVRSSIAHVAGREGRTHVIPNGLAPLPVGLESTRASETPTIVMVGRLERTKGFHDGIDAFAAVRTSVPDARLVIVGRGEDEQRLITRARWLGVADRLQIIPHLPHEECLAIIRSSHVVVVPATMTEGFSLVAAEAGLCGRPVVSTRVGGLAETVEDGITGTVVEPGAIEPMAAAITRYLTDPDLAHQHGAAGRRRVEERYSMTAYAATLADYYRSIAGPSPSPHPTMDHEGVRVDQ